MTFSIDRSIGLPAAALKVHSRRTELLAENIANADTPGFKARDIDFRDAMRQVSGGPGAGLAMSRTNAGHMTHSGESVGNPTPRYRVPANPSLDGNTVELQQEQSRFAESTVHYQASLNFLGSRIQGLIGAIKGE